MLLPVLPTYPTISPSPTHSPFATRALPKYRYHYDLELRPDSLIYPGSVYATWVYGTDGRLATELTRSLTYNGGAGIGDTIDVSRYTYDYRGKVTHVASLLWETADNQYSALGTLVHSTHSTESDMDETFTADAFGNVGTKTSNDDAKRGTGTYTYQAGTGRLVKRHDSVNPGETDSTTYDPEGNQTRPTESDRTRGRRSPSP